MKTKSRTINQIIEEQVQTWMRSKPKTEKEGIVEPVITVSRQPGSGGNVLAELVSRELGYSIFHQEIIHEMAKNSKVSARLLETLDERGLNVLEHWINSLVDRHHLWPDQYMKHLLNVIGALGRHGRTVLIGRGANFVLPSERRLAVRVISAREVRIQNVSREYKVSEREAVQRIVRTESNRKAFIHKYFNADIDAPMNYDLVINTTHLRMDVAVAAVKGALDQWREVRGVKA